MTADLVARLRATGNCALADALDKLLCPCCHGRRDQFTGHAGCSVCAHFTGIPTETDRRRFSADREVMSIRATVYRRNGLRANGMGLVSDEDL